MPTTSVTDPASYTAVLPAGSPTWHGGTGAVTYSFLTQIPTYYASGGGFAIAGRSFAAGSDPAPSSVQVARVAEAFARFGEVANIRFTEATAQPITTPAGAITGSGSLVTGLGGAAGFGETTLARGDDGYTPLSIGAVFGGGLNFYGTTWTSLFVNTNGSVSFGNGLLAYSPGTVAYGPTPVIAPFWADIDTRSGALQGQESGDIHVDLDAANRILTVTWDRVNSYDRNGSAQNSFQLQIFGRGGGDFDIVFRYEAINWSAAADGMNAIAGISAGDGRYFHMPVAGNGAALLALDATVGNSGTTGLWIWQSRGGVISPGTGGSGTITPAAVGSLAIGALDFGSAADGAIAAAPGSAGFNGDVFLNRGVAGMADPVAGSDGWSELMQAIGTAVGLRAPTPGVLGAGFDTRQYSVMSDLLHPDQAGLAAAARTSAATPMLFDIQALQIAYGANMTTRAGDTVYFASGATFAIADGGRFAGAIWDAGGTDLFDASGQTAAVTIDLRPGFFSTIGSVRNGITIALGVPGTRALSAEIENASGGSADDRLTGNGLSNTLWGNSGRDTLDGLDGTDRLFGGLGVDVLRGGTGTDFLFGGNEADRLYGDEGNDTLTGGAARDQFYFTAGTGTDTVTDFRDGEDRINVTGRGLELADFRISTTAPGEVRLVVGGDRFVLQSNNAGFAAADITAADFIGLL